MRRLEAMGELDDTMIVVTGDNGWPFPRGKASIYDSGTHVPLAIPRAWHPHARPSQRRLS